MNETSTPCMNCKKCCQVCDVPINLTARDVFAIAYEKQMEASTVVSRYCNVSFTHGFPRVSVKCKNGVCLFGKTGENLVCSLIRKPDVCRSFPFGNTTWFDEEAEAVTPNCEKHRFVINYSQNELAQNSQVCSSLSRDPFYRKWKQAAYVCDLLLSGLEKESKRLQASELALHYVYQNYNIREPFLSQFDKNMLQLVSLLR